MCMLLELDYAKFGVSSLFLSKVIKEKPLGFVSTPSPQERVNVFCNVKDLLPPPSHANSETKEARTMKTLHSYSLLYK